MTTFTTIQISSPYHLSLALNRGRFPEGFSRHRSNPIRYIVRRASHPVISPTVARLRRDRQEHAGYSRQLPGYTQLCDFVSQHNYQLSRPAFWASAPAKVRLQYARGEKEKSNHDREIPSCGSDTTHVKQQNLSTYLQALTSIYQGGASDSPGPCPKLLCLRIHQQIGRASCRERV